MKEENIKLDILKIIIALIIFVISIINIMPYRINKVLYIVAFLISGYEVIIKAIKNIFKGKLLDENFLMTIATIGAFAINKPKEAIAVMIFYNIGEIFEDLATDKSKKSIRQLMDIKPKIANLKVNNQIKVVEPEELKIGDTIIIKPGEKIPVDGIVISGESQINTSALTGESIPRSIYINSEVFAGCINETNMIEIKVTKEFVDTEINKIIELVKNANKTKSKTEQFITKFAKIYTPIVVGLAVIIAFIIPTITGFQDISEWIKRALVFLVTSCPCAIVISIPLGYFAGIRKAGKEGILIKGSNYLDILGKASCIAMDKTGTITNGNFEVSKIILAEEITEEELLKTAAIAEIMSNHPIAKSIVKAANLENPENKIDNHKEIAGMGIIAKYEEDEIIVGNKKLLEKENIKYYELNEIGAIVYVAKNKKYLGAIVISDTIKEESKQAIQELKNNGIKRICMLTGDNQDIANDIASKVEIEEIYSNLLPEEKSKKLNQLKQEENLVIAVGDGINDSPVLSLADVGIAMGNTGADLAIETSDIVIIDGKLSKLNKTIKISKKTKRIVMQNICLALGIKIIVLTLGALGISSMWEAVFADVGVTIITILNALRMSQ